LATGKRVDVKSTVYLLSSHPAGDAFTIAKVLGHSDLRMTERYTHAPDQNLMRAVDKLANYGQTQKDCHKVATDEKRKAG
jgi:integrase